ncbi:MAG: hypothetical protein ABII12_06530 [Planctomycetota bacterium]
MGSVSRDSIVRFVRVLPLMAVLAVVALPVNRAVAQTIDLTDITTLIGDATNNGDGGTTTHDDNQPGTTPISGRQPTVDNQFATTSGGALNDRRPGLYVQQGIASTNGQLSMIDGTVPEEQLSFFAETFNGIYMNVFDIFGGILGLFNSFVDNLSSNNSSSGSLTFVPPGNAATTWEQNSQTIP